MNSPITVLVVDKHRSILEDVKLRLLKNNLINLIHDSQTVEEALFVLEKYPVNLVIMDINMRLNDGQCATDYFSRRYPNLKILIHSDYNQQDLIANYFAKGANGYVIKSDGEISEAIPKLMEGKNYFSKSVNQTSVNQKQGNLKVRPINFTTVESSILELSAQGRNSEEIAKSLGNARSTIEFHRKKMIKKFKVRNFVELVDFAHRIGKL